MTGFSIPFQSDLLALAGSLLLVAAYHGYLRWRLRHDPSYTIQAINAAARTAWVESIMAKGPDVLAVQTLRNSTMAATFLASTAILLIIGVLNLSEHGAALSGLLPGVDKLRDGARVIWGAKVVSLLLIFFWAFFSFSMAIRMYNHVGYLINTPVEHGSNPSYVARLLNRSGTYYSGGMRSYYLSVPLVFWLFGPVYMFAATVVLVVVLYHVDRAPCPLDEESQSRPSTQPVAFTTRNCRKAQHLKTVSKS